MLAGRVELREVCKVDGAILLRELSKGFRHHLEVGILVSATLSVSLFDRLSKLSAECVKALNVCLDNFKMIKDFILGKVVLISFFNCLTADLGLNEGSVHVVGKRRWVGSLTLRDELLMDTAD